MLLCERKIFVFCTGSKPQDYKISNTQVFDTYSRYFFWYLYLLPILWNFWLVSKVSNSIEYQNTIFSILIGNFVVFTEADRLEALLWINKRFRATKKDHMLFSERKIFVFRTASNPQGYQISNTQVFDTYSRYFLWYLYLLPIL